MDAHIKPVSESNPWGATARVAVIDVGSNTVRLVAFSFEGRVPRLIFNEKAFCGLGRNLGSTGELDKDSMALALSTIHRFATLTSQMGIDQLDMVATAAVREATNRDVFLTDVAKLTGRPLRVISGEEEARYAALGVLAGIPHANGVMGDLGGGSLELSAIDHRKVATGSSLSLGTLRLVEAHGDDRTGARDAIDAALEKLNWLEAMKHRAFYPVGGTWRALARLHMAVKDYPLRILHQYEIDGAEALRFMMDIDTYLDPETLTAAGVAKKRIPMLPMAAVLLERVLKQLEPENVIISALGLREGVLYDNAPADMRTLDPLIAFAQDMAGRRSRFPEQGNVLMQWVAPLFVAESMDERRLRHAVCLLSDIAWAGHPDYRAELAMDQVVLAQMNGADHAARAFMGLALFVLNGGSVQHPSTDRIRLLLNDSQIERAQILGLALRLAQRISGGTEDLLMRTSLTIEGDTMSLTINADGRYLIGEAVERRLNGLATALGLSPAITVKEDMRAV